MMNYRKLLVILGSITTLSVLTGCGHQNLNEVKSYVREVESRPGEAIEPLPTIRPYQPYTYVAFEFRNPFSPPITKRRLGPGGPDMSRPKEPLEAYTLESLRMVGSLSMDGEMWALVLDPKSIVHRVKEGNYVGTQHGRIEKVTEQQIYIGEMIDDGQGGWKKNPTSLMFGK